MREIPLNPVLPRVSTELYGDGMLVFLLPLIILRNKSSSADILMDVTESRMSTDLFKEELNLNDLPPTPIS